MPKGKIPILHPPSKESMIKMMIQKEKAHFMITIDKKIVHYRDAVQDKLWRKAIQYLPPDPNAIREIIMSRGRIPHYFIDLLRIPKKELDEYNNAKDDNELKDLVIRDAKKNGCHIIDIKIE